MTPDAFRKTLAAGTPPATLTDLQRALWFGARGDWDEAHKLAQDNDGADAAWVHAWLHRIEGDLDNARYWYGQAGRDERHGTTDEELGELLSEFLTETG